MGIRFVKGKMRRYLQPEEYVEQSVICQPTSTSWRKKFKALDTDKYLLWNSVQQCHTNSCHFRNENHILSNLARLFQSVVFRGEQLVFTISGTTTEVLYKK